jgi:hypothetical protein
MTVLGTACRLLIVAGAAAAALASGSSGANRPADGDFGGHQAPESQPMAADQALGLWKSSFGPVKIEKDDASGEGYVRGVWVYDRAGQEVIGYFSGPLDGNVLQFRWQEPAKPSDLVGDGYLVFEPGGRTFTGKWWTTSKDRGGDWQGWRHEGAGAPAEGAPPEGGPSRNDGVPRPKGDAEQAPPPGEEPPPGSESI